MFFDCFWYIYSPANTPIIQKKISAKSLKLARKNIKKIFNFFMIKFDINCAYIL